MKRNIRLAGPILLTVAAISPAHAQNAETVLPLRDVVLFSSGVGYFQRAGSITGSAQIPLSFRAEQINDILKSLVLFDAAGAVRPVTYTTKDSITRRLRAAGLDINSSITLGTLLRQFQGAAVSLSVRAGTGEETVTGRILSVSSETVPATIVAPGNAETVQPAQIEVLNLMATSGARQSLRAIPLKQISRVELQDERLNTELQESLQLLSANVDEQRRSVQLGFAGAGTREVRAGYLEEMPVWKTSYRLVLDKDAKPYLQGWGIVENTTDEDWNNVHLSLVSGRPISFVQDLYQPLYVPRPEVAPQIIGSPLPQTYNERVDSNAKAPRRAPAATAAPATLSGGAIDALTADKPMGGPVGATSGLSSGGGGGAVFYARNGAADSDGEGAKARDERGEIALSAKKLAQSVASQAQGLERGDLFEYAISQPVTLPRQQAAMVPIVSQAIEGERLSIYDPNSIATRALNGFRLKNTTGLHLSGGPITVFQDGTYAGDAQVSNVQPNEDRLISYAVDLDLVVDHKEPESDAEITAISVIKGVLYVTQKERLTNLYTFRNKSAAAKTVLVQQAIQPEYDLVLPAKPAEKTAEEYRFKVEVPASKSAELKVVTEHLDTEETAVLDSDLDMLVEYAHNTQVSPTMRAALGQLVMRRRKLWSLKQQRLARENDTRVIDHEQARIRKNMGQLNRNNPLYLQYVTKLTAQEHRMEQLRAEITRLNTEEFKARQELDAYVATLTLK